MTTEETKHQIVKYLEDSQREANLRGYEQGVKDTTDTSVYSSGFWSGFAIASILYLLGTFFYKLLA